MDFFEAFKNFDEAGSMQRIQVLKYVVLTNMLMESEIDPFDSQETKPYKSDPRIEAMTALVGAYQRMDVYEFERILKDRGEGIIDDPFIHTYLDEILSNIRTQVILNLIKPYTLVKLSFLSERLRITYTQLENLLVAAILDEKLHAKINEVDGTLEILKEDGVNVKKATELQSWTKGVERLWHLIDERPRIGVM
jgi:COP9 signalosome complex subunit 2